MLASDLFLLSQQCYLPTQGLKRVNHLGDTEPCHDFIKAQQGTLLLSNLAERLVWGMKAEDSYVKFWTGVLNDFLYGSE